MKKKTILLGLLMAGMAVTAVTGCSSKKDTKSGATENQEAKHYAYFYDEDGNELFKYEIENENDVIPSFEVPKKTGYEGTWTTRKADGNIYYFPIYVKTNVTYTINYLLENLNNNDYVLSDTYSATATANSEIRPLVRTFDGFECIDGGSTIVVNEDNSTINLHYNRYRYTVKYETNNGQTIQDQTVKYGTKLTLPTVSRDGYTLDGWYNNNQLFDNTKGVESNLNLSARWTPNSGIKYNIEYYFENIENNEYTKSNIYSKELTGSTDQNITAEDLGLEGFILDNSKSTLNGKVAYDGSLVLKVYYNRQKYTVNFDPDNGQTIASQTVKYDQKLTEPQVSKEGYEFICWKSNNVDFDFNTGVKSNLTLTAYYAANTDTAYKVIIHKQHIYDDDYDIETSTLYGTTDTTATYSPLSYTGFVLMDEKSTTSGNIEPDGSLELHLYYDRYEFNVEFETNINGVTLDSETVRYGAKLSDPNLSREGYTFSGWYDQFDRTFIFGSTEVIDNLVLTAYWDANTDTEFRVEYYYENIEDDDYTLNEDESYTDTYTTDERYTINPSVRTGFEVYYAHPDYHSSDYIAGDGSTVLRIYYKREIKTITFVFDDYSEPLNVEVKYGALVEEPEYERVGYTLNHWQSDWYGDFDFDTPIEFSETLVAIWDANTDTKYRIEYYFENIEDDGYTLNTTYSGDFEGTTDTTVYAKTNPIDLDVSFDYFYNNPNVEGYKYCGNIEPDGSLVLKVYFKRATYEINFYTNTAVELEGLQDVKHGAKIDEPAALEKAGYDFNYWYYYDDNSEEVQFNFDEDVITSNKVLYAKWTARTDTQYRVEYYYQNVDDDEYTLDEEQSYNSTGETDSYISVSTTAPEGFNYSYYISNYDGYISGDGSTVLKLYFEREYYYVYLIDEYGTYNESLYVKYGSKIEQPEVSRDGYDLECWYYNDGNGDVPFDFENDVVEYNIYLYTKWKARNDTHYTVKVYIQNADDNEYKFDHSYDRTGTTDKQFNEIEDVNNYNVENKYYVYEYDNDAIAGDGSTVIEVLLHRYTTQVKVTYSSTCCSINQSSTFELRYGEAFNLQVTDKGAAIYKFSGIYVNDELATPNDSYTILPTEDDIANKKINIEIKYDIKEELSNFTYNYSSSDNELELIGIKEDAVFEDDIVVIPDYVTALRSNFMNGDKKYTQVVLGSGLKEIQNNAFSNSALESIFIPKSVETIGYQAFDNANLASVTFEEDSNLHYIGQFSFSDNGNLEEFIIPKSVTDIANGFIGNQSPDAKYIDIRFEEGSQLTELPDGIFTYAKINSIIIPNTITSLGNQLFYSSYIKSITFEEGSTITEIPSQCFSSASICTIELPDTIETIGDNAFYYCHAMNANVEESIILPEGVKSIGYQAFYHISNINVNLPNSIETIGDMSFYNANLGGTLTLPSSLKTIGYQAFQNNYYSAIMVNEGLEEIGNDAFYGCSSLGTVFNYSNLDIVAGETTHGYVAYYASAVYDSAQCQNLVFDGSFIILNESGEKTLLGYNGNDLDIVIPEGITAIGENVFASNTKIRSVVIPYTVTSIGAKAFNSCKGLVTIEIGANVASIGSDAFTGCDHLYDIHNRSSLSLTKGNYDYGRIALNAKSIDSGMVDINNFIEDDNLIIYSMGEELYLIKYYGTDVDIEIPEGVTEICYEAFREQYSIKSVVIPASVKYIGAYAFYNCNKIDSLYFAEGSQLVEIYARAFYGCYNLGEVILPAHLKRIDEYAFAISSYDSNRGTHITHLVLNDELETIKEYAFSYAYYGYELVIPDSVKYIGPFAFQSCYNLTYVELGSGVETIERFAFSGTQVIEIYNKSSLTIANGDGNYTNGGLGYSAEHIYSSSTEQKYVGYDDDFVYYDDGTNYILIEYTGDNKDLVIPTGVTRLYAGFVGVNENIESIFIPNTVKTIDGSVFYSLPNLTSITFEEGSILESVGNYAFSSLRDLEELYLPSSLKTIGDHAFSGMSNVDILVFAPDSQIEYIGDRSIDGSYDLIVVLPNNAINSTTERRFSRGNTSQLADIYFYGTEEDYAALGLENEAYYYSETEPTLTDANYWHFDENGKPVAWTAEE